MHARRPIKARCAVGFCHVHVKFRGYGQVSAESADAKLVAAPRTKSGFTRRLTGNACNAPGGIQPEQQDSAIRCHHCAVGPAGRCVPWRPPGRQEDSLDLFSWFKIRGSTVPELVAKWEYRLAKEVA